MLHLELDYVHFLKKKTGLGIVHRIGISVCKSTIDPNAGANRGTTQIGEQYETIMALFPTAAIYNS